MRLISTIATLSFLLAAAAASAQQQNNWNNPSTQQQGEIKDVSGSVKDGLNNIGSAEQPGQGDTNYANPSGVDGSKIHDQAQDLAKQGSDAINSVWSR